MKFRMKALLSGAFLLGTLAAPLAAMAAPLVERPIVISHRGASGYLPESTLESYKLAVQMGADFIEPDLFLTADGVLVARHDRNLNTTTNVQAVAASNPALAAKATGSAFNVEDLTYADIQLLSARSRGDSAGTNGYAKAGNGYYTAADTFAIVTFNDVLDYAYQLYLTTGEIVGVYPEVKTITGDAAYNQAIATAMIAALGDAKYSNFFDGSRNNVFLQSFDETVVKYLNDVTNNPDDLPVAYLITNCQTAGANAANIATIADGVGTSIGNISQTCVDQLHAEGLLVHAYTLTTDALMGPTKTYAKILELGVDGIFSNFPDTAVASRDTLYPVPEPATAALFGAGLLGLAGLRRRKAG